MKMAVIGEPENSKAVCVGRLKNKKKYSARDAYLAPGELDGALAARVLRVVELAGKCRAGGWRRI